MEEFPKTEDGFIGSASSTSNDGEEEANPFE
jgi:hypothetical protein